MTTSVPETAAPPAAFGFVPLTVTAVDQLTEDAVAVTFSAPPMHRRAFAFRAGQHLTLRHWSAGQDLRRTYSLCSDATGGLLRVAVKRLDGGLFSAWICHELRPGDVVEALPPAGSFGPHLDPARARRYGLLAAGSGITPVISIAATALATERLSDVVLLYGNRTAREVMFLEELSDLKDRFPERLQVLHALSREEQESELLSGRLDPERLRRLLTSLDLIAQVDEWYLCGPFGLVTDGRRVLVELGADPSQVHVELFHAAAPPPRPPRPAGDPAGSSTVVAELHGRTTRLQVPQDGASVLEALLAVRADTPFACKGGVCGTCRAQVTSGRVEMDVNYALEQDELDAGVVLTCQSHPVTETVELEFL